jgi:hypothetical protein
VAEKTVTEKIEDARKAIAQAGMLLTQHAEGLAMLQMAAMTPDPALLTVSPGRPAYLPDRELGHSYRNVIMATVRFAGEYEAFDQIEESRFPCRETKALRRAVEEFVGPEWGAQPPHASCLSESVEARYGVKPRRVVAQAWRDHLAALAIQARPKLKWVKAGAA